VAAVLWGLLVVRDLLFVVFVSIWIVEGNVLGTNQIFPLALIQEPGLLLATLVSGIAGAVTAAVTEATRRHHFLGLCAGGVAVGACVTPGLLLGFGIVGVVLGAIALLLHAMAGGEFERRAPYPAAPAPALLP
jgi:hypothetical protein